MNEKRKDYGEYYSIICEFLDDLTNKYDNDPNWTLNKIIKKWEERIK